MIVSPDAKFVLARVRGCILIPHSLQVPSCLLCCHANCTQVETVLSGGLFLGNQVLTVEVRHCQDSPASALAMMEKNPLAIYDTKSITE